MIDFYNLNKLDNFLHKKIINNFKKNIKKGDFILGNDVKNFENKYSKYIGSKFSVGCANGTDALLLALKSLNLPKGSEVIIPAMTYCSTAFAVINAGLKPVLVDIENNTPLIDIDKIRKKINSKTKVIMPVHLYGSVVNLSKIRKITKSFKEKIFIVDDCAQAHGAFINKKNKIGSNSDISCFSLYPGKNLGAYGDAGIITTNSHGIYKKLSKLRNLGSEKKFKHDMIGFNSRLDTIQASILSLKLDHLDKYNFNRKKIAKFYDTNITNKKITILKYSNNAVYHQYVVLTKNRSLLVALLKKNKIGFGFHYPQSINQLNSLKKMYKNQKFINAENLAKSCVSLPIDPNLTSNDVKRIVKVINSF